MGSTGSNSFMAPRTHTFYAFPTPVSGVAGLVTTTVTAPVDMVKTNMFVNSSLYSGPWDCVAQIYRAQGVRGLFKGWGANWARQGPMTTVIFVVSEDLRHRMGLEAM